MSCRKTLLLLLIVLNIIRLECIVPKGPKTFYGCNHEFMYFIIPYKTFCGAMITCQLWKPGATLAMPKTKCINDVIEEMNLDIGRRGNTPWLGATDTLQENAWIWLDGTRMDGYKNWVKTPTNEPNGGTSENCLQILYLKYWNDVSCTRINFPYICQIDLSRTSSSDYKEVSLTRRTVNFADAKTGCESQGSRLVEITDEKSFETARQIMGKNSRKKYWIGANFTNEGWKWLSGADFGFQKWLQGQPSSGGTNRCLAMAYNGFSDYDCDSYAFRYICETVRPYNLRISEERPVIIESERIEISCTASAYPPPVVVWTRDDKPVVQDDTHDIHQVMGDANAKLVIHNAALKDGGKYYCTAVDTINGTKFVITGFTYIKVISHADDIETTIENWKLEESDKPNNFITTNANFDATCGPCKTPAWILPVFLMLGMIAVVLSAAVAVLLYLRSSKVE